MSDPGKPTRWVVAYDVDDKRYYVPRVSRATRLARHALVFDDKKETEAWIKGIDPRRKPRAMDLRQALAESHRRVLDETESGYPGGVIETAVFDPETGETTYLAKPRRRRPAR